MDIAITRPNDDFDFEIDLLMANGYAITWRVRDGALTEVSVLTSAGYALNERTWLELMGDD